MYNIHNRFFSLFKNIPASSHFLFHSEAFSSITALTARSAAAPLPLWSVGPLMKHWNLRVGQSSRVVFLCSNLGNPPGFRCTYWQLESWVKNTPGTGVGHSNVFIFPRLHLRFVSCAPRDEPLL